MTPETDFEIKNNKKQKIRIQIYSFTEKPDKKDKEPRQTESQVRSYKNAPTVHPGKILTDKIPIGKRRYMILAIYDVFPHKWPKYVYKIIVPKNNQTMYLSYNPKKRGKKVYPRTGEWGGLIRKTSGGKSLKLNIKSKDIFDITRVWNSAGLLRLNPIGIIKYESIETKRMTNKVDEAFENALSYLQIHYEKDIRDSMEEEHGKISQQMFNNLDRLRDAKNTLLRYLEAQ